MWRKLLFFSSLYFVQGAALAYVINFQKPFLSGRGISKETIGLFTSLLLLPFILKVVLGYISDRGGRKPYMVFGLGLFAVCYFALASVDPGTSFLGFATLTWLASLGLAWFDTCADGWAIDVAKEEEQGAIQAAMISGKSLGLILMSVGFGYAGMRFGFGAIFYFLAALAGVVLLVVARVEAPTRKETPKGFAWRELVTGAWLAFAAFGVVYSIASFGTDGLMTLYFSEIHALDSWGIGVFGMVRGIGALVGAGLFVLVSRKLGVKKSAFAALAMLALGCLLPSVGLAPAITALLWGMAWAFQETSFVTLAMRYSRGAFAATLFATAMIFSNVGTSVGEGLGAPLVPILGYMGVFGSLAALALASMIFIPWLYSSKSKA